MNPARRIMLAMVIFSARLVSAEDLVFHTVSPCVAFDTRPSLGGSGMLAAEEARTFHIVGSLNDFAAQGGAAGGCGVPGFSGGNPQVQAVFINLVAITATGGGTLRAWATDQVEPVQGALVNFQALTPPLNTAN